MKPPPFDYYDPTTLQEALDLLRQHGEEGKILAGGQSLVPLLNLRLTRPRAIIDINKVRELDYIREADGGLAIGALARDRAVETSPLVAQRCPLLVEAARWVGHLQIRNLGTFGGSLAHADPAAEFPAVVTALGGTLVVQGPAGTRTLPPAEFFLTYLTTTLQPTEMLTEIRLPALPLRTGHAFVELARRHGDFAIVGVAAIITLDAQGVCRQAGIALAGAGPTPIRAEAACARLVGERLTPALLREAAARAGDASEPDSDLHASAGYRREMAQVLTRRALEQALGRLHGRS